MIRTLYDAFFARPIVRYPDDLPELWDLASHDDSGLADYLSGQRSFPEIYASRTARDSRLGFVNRFVEFVPTTWEEARAGGITLSDVAIGPALGREDFDALSDLVLPAVLREMRMRKDNSGRMQGTIIVDRVDYTIDVDGRGVSVGGIPLFDPYGGGPDVIATARWLAKAVEAMVEAQPEPQ